MITRTIEVYNSIGPIDDILSIHNNLYINISWNTNRVFIEFSNYQGDMIRKGISINKDYIAWLEKNEGTLAMLFTKNVWYKDKYEVDKYLKEFKNLMEAGIVEYSDLLLS